jgi:hypothetical protein
MPFIERVGGQRIKQSGEPHQGVTIDQWLVGKANAGADARIEHPRRDPFARLVGQTDVD